MATARGVGALILFVLLVERELHGLFLDGVFLYALDRECVSGRLCGACDKGIDSLCAAPQCMSVSTLATFLSQIACELAGVVVDKERLTEGLLGVCLESACSLLLLLSSTPIINFAPRVFQASPGLLWAFE